MYNLKLKSSLRNRAYTLRTFVGRYRLNILKTEVMILQLDRHWKEQPRANDFCLKQILRRKEKQELFSKLRSSRCFLITHLRIKHIHKSILWFLFCYQSLAALVSIMLVCLVVNLIFSRDIVFPTVVIWKYYNVLSWEGESTLSTNWTWTQWKETETMALIWITSICAAHQSLLLWQLLPVTQSWRLSGDPGSTFREEWAQCHFLDSDYRGCENRRAVLLLP